MSEGRKLKFGLFIQAAGHHTSGWRHKDAQSGSENFELIKQLAQTAERAKLDMVFLADGLITSPDAAASVIARFEPITLLAALSTVTSRIGLAVTASTTYYDPFNIARLLASVDQLSQGRAAWNVVTTSSPEAVKTFRGKITRIIICGMNALRSLSRSSKGCGIAGNSSPTL